MPITTPAALDEKTGMRPDSSPMTRTDYDASQNAEKAVAAQVNQDTSGEAFSADERIDAEAQARLPFFRARQGVENPNAAQFARDDVTKAFAAAGEPFLQAGADDYPELQTMAAEQTQRYNEVHGTDYPPPAIGMMTNLKEYTGTSSMYYSDRDMIVFDPEILERLRTDPNYTQGLIAHEISHRYQNTDEDLLHQLRFIAARNQGIEPTTKMLEANRVREGKADIAAAEVTSPEKVSAFLVGTAHDGWTAYNRYYDETMRADPNTPEGQIAVDFPNLSEFERTGLLARGLHETATSENMHPSYVGRLELMRALKDNPELLKRDLQVDSQANIIHVEGEGPAYTPAQLDQINTNADKAVGIRGQVSTSTRGGGL